MKKKVLIFALLLVATSALFAGRYGGDFMMIGAGVRSLGMGGAFAALADDSSAIYWNSGGLAQNSQVRGFCNACIPLWKSGEL